LDHFKVEVSCTTDDPADSLEHHRAIAASGCKTKVLPTFRPDALTKIDQPEFFNAYVERLAAAADTDVTTCAGLFEALEKRHAFFHENGCRLSDHGLPRAAASFASDSEVAAVYDKA